MKFEKVTGTNYIKVTDLDGTIKLLPQSFIVKAGINGHLLIGSEGQIYEYDEPELTVQFTQVEGQEEQEEFAVLLHLSTLFIGTSTEKLDVWNDLRIANLILFVSGEMKKDEFIATLQT